ncbi:glycosyltransferase [Pseudoalteromonas sp. T1lg65]|uniref:glycosyltransferase n=1 Tax=Pseudoalteromonas sp. T1lg65 TaxID=2077101 RepID=UPI003F796432
MSSSCGSQFPKVIIGIPTYKRPKGLARLLNSIAKLSIAEMNVSVLVADNDQAEQAGIHLVEQLRAEYPLRIDTVVVENRGISFVRNAMLEIAFGKNAADYFAMVDDDEWVEPNWLYELIAMHKASGCEVVGGVALAEFESDKVPEWTKELSIYFPEQVFESREIDLLESSANALLHKSVYFGFNQQRFNPFYSVYGGGDKEYFTRLKAQGVRFAVAHKAVSHEVYGRSRTCKSWAAERAFRIGAADMRIIMLHHCSWTKVSKELVKLVMALFFGMFSYLFSFTSQSKRMKGKLLILRQIGKINGLLNKHKPVYKKVHGE